MDVADNDAPPPEWGQWGNQPASAPEHASGVLVMWEDGYVMSSRAVMPAPIVADTHTERGPGCAGVPPAHFDEAQVEQALW
jgi:hypothetical protein